MMKRTLIAPLALLLFAQATALAQELRPSDIVGPDTRSICLYGVISDSLESDIEDGKMKAEGTLTTVGESIFVQTLTEGLLLLRSGRGDVMWCLYPTAQYISARNPEFATVCGVYPFSLSMLASLESRELIDALNRGLAGMMDDGTMDALWTEHVEGALAAGGDPVPVPIPAAGDSEIIRVGVSGDIPPMDYVAADGTPAGFNTAVIAELARRERLGVEIVQVDSGARFAALAAGRIDVFFWQTRMEGLDENSYAGDADQARETEDQALSCLTTIPYRTMYAGWLFMAK